MAGDSRPTFLEFFAGGGMARLGLEPDFACAFANEIDAGKGRTYAANFGAGAVRVADVADLTHADLPGRPDLAWASFPCQDLSLAGPGGGLNGARSGTFWPFWRLMEGLAGEGRAPGLLVLENVTGALTSHGGRDFAALVGTLTHGGWRVGALVIDAALFLPQSRPRLFLIGVRAGRPIAPGLLADGPTAPFHPPALARAVAGLPAGLAAAHLWWRLPPPSAQPAALADVLEPDGREMRWRSPEQTARLLSLMSPLHQRRVAEARASGERRVGTVFRRTRPAAGGQGLQRAEVRFDGLAGCLRTPAGGSSRQLLLVVEGGAVRSRLITPRESARLMGLPEAYVLPAAATEALHLTGDGVAVDVARHLARGLLQPLAAAA